VDTPTLVAHDILGSACRIEGKEQDDRVGSLGGASVKSLCILEKNMDQRSAKEVTL
jgi:hypothetical protein